MTTRKTAVRSMAVIAAACALALPSCKLEKLLDDENDTDPDASGSNVYEVQTVAFDGVDLLVMVDNSGSMAEEQAILSTGFFTLVNSIAHPLPGWPYEAVDSIRIAVVSSNMGISYGEDQDVPDDAVVPDSLLQTSANCQGNGDNGQFQDLYTDQIALQSGVIACDESAVQCPAGWTCAEIQNDTHIGTCQSAVTMVDCALEGSYAETTPDIPNAALTTQAACLAWQGVSGCGFEQQLQSAAVALKRDDQQSFMQETHLLAVLLVTDEEDCSMQDAPALFATEECVDATMLNIACNVDSDNEQYLFDPAYFHEVFTSAKGNPGAVIFAAIAGVPHEGEAAGRCQGRGDVIGDCLGEASMQMTPYEDTQWGTPGIWKFTPVCTREVDGALVTSAVPGRRYVTLASDYFGKSGYVYSICNPNWSPAMVEVGRLIAQRIGGSCFQAQLPWSGETKTSTCQAYAEFVSPAGDECPWNLAEGDEATVETETTATGTITTVRCPLPRLPAELDCDANDPDGLNAGFGWYYCENAAHEDNNDACDDTIDNDADGLTDCASAGCATCSTCGGDDSACLDICRYNPVLTDSAKLALLGAPVQIVCPE